MRNYIHGELSEWSKVQHSKCCVPKRNLGFESLTLRQKVRKIKVFRLFFFARLLKIGSKLWKEQPVFWKELRLFCLFRRIRTVKLGSFRRHINFHSIYCQNSPFRATPFRLPLHLPRTVLTSSQDERKC